MNDRNYWRSQDTSRLIDEAFDSGHELAIVLAERLEDMDVEAREELAEWQQKAHDLQIDCNQLDDKVYELHAEIEQLELMIAERDRLIEELKNV
jgi:peptidoglycan hydrolase CwlO-like protein